MRTTIHRKQLRETPFFDISGLQGRLYLEAFSLGEDDPLDQFRSGGNFDLRDLEQSPLTLVPDPAKAGTSILLRTLRKFRSDSTVYPALERIDTCSIGTEWQGEHGIETTTIFLFFKCDLSRLRRFGANDRFQIDFGHLQRVGAFLSKQSW